MSGADVSKSKMVSSLSRLSKMDILAQKQNRIAEKKLNAAITSIDRERAAFKVNHRSLLQELRWELQDVRSCTGHSEQGRPPTSDELQRMNTWMPSRHSGGGGGAVSHLPPSSRQRAPLLTASFRGGLPPLREADSPTQEGVPPEHLYSDSDDDDGDVDAAAAAAAAVAAAYGQLKPTTACERADGRRTSTSRNAAGGDDDDRRQADGAASPSSPLPRSADADARESASAADAVAEDSPDEELIAGKLEEMKRIMNMPTIYQTQELQKQRGLPRHVLSLPPIKFFDDDDDGGGETAAHHSSTAAAAAHARGDERHERPRLLPELLASGGAPAAAAARADGAIGGGAHVARADAAALAGRAGKNDDAHASTNRMPSVTSASADLLAEVRRAKAAATAHRPLGLTKATSVGTVYKPENIRLVGRSFTKDELVSQHRSLLEQNKSERDVNPAKGQMTRLQSRVDAFLSLVSVQQLGSTGRSGPAAAASTDGKAQMQLPPVAVGGGGGGAPAARLTVGEKRSSGAR